MTTQTWAEWFAPNPSQIILSLGPVQSVSSISYYDTDNALQTSLLTNYYVLRPSTRTLIKPKTGYAWPTTFTRDDAIKVEYVIGYGDTFRDVPSTLRHAILMLVSHYYENRKNELIGTITMFLGPLLKVYQELAHGLRITILVTQTARQKLLLVMKPDPATSRYFTALNTRGFDGQTNSGIRT